MNPTYIIVFTLWINSMHQISMMRSVGLGKSKTKNQHKTRASDFHLKLKGRQRKDQIRRQVCEYIETCKTDGKKYTEDQEVTVGSITPPTFRKMQPLLPPNLDYQPVFSVPDVLANDTSCMGFEIPPSYFQNETNIRALDIYVYIKVRKKRKQLRRITLKIVSFGNSIYDRTQVARKKFRPNETKWYKVSLPIAVLTKLHTSSDNTLSLCIQCKRCNRRIQVIFPIKAKKQIRYMRISKKKNLKRKASRQKFLRLNRPFLICRPKEKVMRRRRRHLTSCGTTAGEEKCCRVDRFVSFRKLGLQDDVIYPPGLRLTTCAGACTGDDKLHSKVDRNVTRQCGIRVSNPIQVFTVFKKRIGYIEFRNGDVKLCGCVAN